MSVAEILPSPGFDYGHVGDNLAVDLRACARRIRDRMVASVIETGRDLLGVKDQLDHGQFIAWVEAECALSPRTAQRMMAAAEWAEGKNDTVSHLPPTVIYALSAPSTPVEIHNAILARIEAGERVDPDAVKTEIAEVKLKAARAAKFARLTPEQKAAKKGAETRRRNRDERHEREWQKSEEQRARALDNLVDFLIENVTDHDRLVELLAEAGWGCSHISQRVLEKRNAG